MLLLGGLFLLLLFTFLSITASITRLGPGVDHFNFLDPSTHHSVVRVLVREDSLNRRARKIRASNCRWLVAASRGTFFVFKLCS